MSLSNVCPTCFATDGDHGFDCDEVEHWDDHGYCAVCGADWIQHEHEDAYGDEHDQTCPICEWDDEED